MYAQKHILHAESARSQDVSITLWWRGSIKQRKHRGFLTLFFQCPDFSQSYHISCLRFDRPRSDKHPLMIVLLYHRSEKKSSSFVDYVLGDNRERMTRREDQKDPLHRKWCRGWHDPWIRTVRKRVWERSSPLVYCEEYASSRPRTPRSTSCSRSL